MSEHPKRKEVPVEDDRTREVIGQIMKLTPALDRALDFALENAKSEVARLAEHCVKTVDLYLKHQICSFEQLYAFIEKSSGFAFMQLMRVSQDLYMNQLVVLDCLLLESTLPSADIRATFIEEYNKMLLQLVPYRKSITELNKSLFEYRQEEVSKAIVDFKNKEREVQERREKEGKEVLEIPKDRMGTTYMRWKTTQYHAFDVNVDDFHKGKAYLEDEFARSLDHCKEVSQMSIEYCKASIDRSLEADAPVFDELINWTKADVSNALQSCGKIKQRIAEQLSVKAIGNVVLNDEMEFTLKCIDYKHQTAKSQLLLDQKDLIKYRIDERTQAIERYLKSLDAHESESIERQIFEDSRGLLCSIPTRDLSECDFIPIGNGGQGTVYSLLLEGRQFAAKRFRNEKDRRKELIALSRVCKNPNVLDVICRGYRGDELFLVTEYCQSSLAAELKRRRDYHRPLDKADFTDWIRQLTAGMKYLHNRDIDFGADVYHGDLKPENILITEKGGKKIVKLADFGLSHLMSYSNALDPTKLSKGTYRYMAPELARGEVDVRYLKKSDVWSWAVVVWEMAANRRPHDALDDIQALLQIGKNSIHPPLPHGTIESLENLLRRCWNVEALLRPDFYNIEKEVDVIIEEIYRIDEEKWLQYTSRWGNVERMDPSQSSMVSQ